MPKKPETILQDAIVKMLRGKSWVVKETHGNLYQSGFPDVYAAHIKYGSRWIEVKNPKGYRFQPSQLQFFKQLSSVGVGVWVLTGSEEEDYKKLFMPANWFQFL